MTWALRRPCLLSRRTDCGWLVALARSPPDECTFGMHRPSIPDLDRFWPARAGPVAPRVTPPAEAVEDWRRGTSRGCGNDRRRASEAYPQQALFRGAAQLPMLHALNAPADTAISTSGGIPFLEFGWRRSRMRGGNAGKRPPSALGSWPISPQQRRGLTPLGTGSHELHRTLRTARNRGYALHVSHGAGQFDCTEWSMRDMLSFCAS